MCANSNCKNKKKTTLCIIWYYKALFPKDTESSELPDIKFRYTILFNRKRQDLMSFQLQPALSLGFFFFFNTLSSMGYSFSVIVKWTRIWPLHWAITKIIWVENMAPKWKKHSCVAIVNLSFLNITPTLCYQ